MHMKREFVVTMSQRRHNSVTTMQQLDPTM